MTWTRSFRTRLLTTAASWGAAIFAFVVILGPEVRHNWVLTPTVTDDAVAAMRADPPRAVLDEIVQQSMAPPVGLTGRELLAAAEAILAGKLTLSGHESQAMSFPFSIADLEKGRPGLQLQTASLVTADILLAAHEETRDAKYFEGARRVILEFAEAERRALWPRGLLWNDHAAANRVAVLARFWRTYRAQSDLDVESARRVLEFAARTGELLAKPSHFTFATNHGVMQNVALMQVALAFPRLPGSERFRRLGAERLRLQLGHFINGEGVVLEDSAGYHQFGVALLTDAFRLMELHGLPVPIAEREKLVKARGFLGELQRPDGSLPVIGDTSADWTQARSTLRASGRPGHEVAVYPSAGYAVWWSGLDRWPTPSALSQTVATWSHYSGAWPHGRQRDERGDLGTRTSVDHQHRILARWCGGP